MTISGYKINYYFSIVFLLCSLNGWGQKNNKVSKQTPEPHTKLSCGSWIAVQKVNEVIQTGNVDSVFNYYLNKLPKSIVRPGMYFDAKIGVDSIPVRLFYPSKQTFKHRLKNNLPVVVFYHGGGFIWGSLDMFHLLAHKISTMLNCIVVLPDYRLAPKYPFPIPVNDCYAVLDWVFNHIHHFGGNPKKIGLMGDSAGANLALVCSVKNSHEKKSYPILFQVLYYPSTSMLDEKLDSRKYFMGDSGDWYVLNRKLLEQIKSSYLQGYPDSAWQVSPLYAPFRSDMPPSLIITAECDPLRDEGEALAQKMQNKGMTVESIRYPKTIHGFVSLYPVLRQGKRALKETKRFVSPYFKE